MKNCSSYVTRKTPGDTVWFQESRFGMFLHFGLYSMAARHEWVKAREKMPEEKYDQYFRFFNPDLLDAKEWARQAKAAGMKYAVLTTKHHDGFCLFDSAYTDYTSVNTPFGRDIVREYVDAFRAEGLRIGLYYSLLDWHHPEFPIDWFHPRRDDADAQQISAKRDIRRYAQYMRNQLTELMTNYGKIDILWTDFSYDGPERPKEAIWKSQPWMTGKGKDEWESEKLVELVRSLQPGIIINNRAGIDQDIWTPEQTQLQSWVRDEKTGELLTWECCHTFSGSWGYYRDELTWKSPEQLLALLIGTVASGGNLIMNVGPNGRGCFDARAQKALAVYADWMRVNSRSIYGCTMAEPEFEAPQGCRLTQSMDGTRLYIHLMEYPFGKLALHNMAHRIEYAQFLHDASQIQIQRTEEIQFGDYERSQKDVVFLSLPVVKPDVRIPVIEIFLRETEAAADTEK